MPEVIFLGTGAALPTAEQDNTSILFESQGRYLMVDCNGTPYRKLLQVKVDPNKLDHVLITHAHVDHCYALPSLVECLWIAGRKETLHIYALRAALAILEPLLDLFDLRHRMINYFPIEIHPLEGTDDELAFKDNNFTLRTNPTLHAIPSVACKVIFPSGTDFVYTSDTAPSQGVIKFAGGAKNFMMECTYCDEEDGLATITRHTHSSEWAEVASIIKAEKTFLIHNSKTETCPNPKLLEQIEKAGGFPAANVLIPHDLEKVRLA